jgi:hypothetical protein
MQYRPLSSRVVGGAALTLALGLAQAALALPALAAAPAGDNGTLKIHEIGTPADDNANEPKVCHFSLDAAGFDASQSALAYEILKGAPFTGDPVLTGSLSLVGGTGSVAIEGSALGDGHYKVQLVGVDTKGADNFKVFWISCPAPVPPPVIVPPVPPVDTPPVDTPPVDTPPVTPPVPPVDTSPVTPPAPDLDGLPVVVPPVVTPPVVTPPVVTPPVVTPPVVTHPVVATTGGGGTITRGGGSLVASGSSTPVSAPVTSGTVAAAASSLPFTGDTTGSLALWALGAIGAGSVLLVGGRRRDGKHTL